MRIPYNPKNNPRVIIIQKLYGKTLNKDEKILFPRHRFKKFIKDIVEGSIERKEVIDDEIKKHLSKDLNIKNLDKVFQVIIQSAIFEMLYKQKIPRKVIIKEYLVASNFFLTESQTKYLNAILDKISKEIRISNAWISTN